MVVGFLHLHRHLRFFLATPEEKFKVCEISARRTNDDHHGIIDITAFNTDGFDVSGRNVWIHDVEVWDKDGCIAVKVKLLSL